MLKENIKKNIVIALLVIGSFTLAFSLLEIFLRTTNYHYYPLQIQVLGARTDNENNSGSDWRRYHIFEHDAFIFDPQLLWKPNPEYQIVDNDQPKHFFNTLGYPGPLFNPLTEGSQERIITIGDSHTLGLPIIDRQTGREVGWPAYLEANLGRTFEVINGGVWGYSSYQMLKRFQQALDYKPAIVLWTPSANDAHLVGVSDKEYGIIQIASTEALVKLRSAQLIQSLLDKMFKDTQKDKEQLVPRVSLLDYKTELSTVIDETSKRNIKLILLNRPLLHPYPDSEFENRFQEYNKLTELIARENSIHFIDVDALFATDSQHFADSSHLNEEGLKILANTLKSLLWPDI